MNRRSFLAGILAAGAAPYVMSNGIAGGVLMPVRQTVIVDEDDIIAPARIEFWGGARPETSVTTGDGKLIMVKTLSADEAQAFVDALNGPSGSFRIRWTT